MVLFKKNESAYSCFIFENVWKYEIMTANFLTLPCDGCPFSQDVFSVFVVKLLFEWYLVISY